MRKLIIICLIIAIAALAACAAGTGRPGPALSPPTTEDAPAPDAAASKTPVYKKIAPEDVRKMMDGGDDLIIVDVRTPEEFRGGHLEGAVNIPVEAISDEKPAELKDPDALIIIYCRTGNRTVTAYEKLAALGYTNVYDMGGIVDWPYETVTETAAATDSAAPVGDVPAFNDAAGADSVSPGGILSAFNSTDISGNPVDESVFSGKKLTMVNVWATFCGPCLAEMPDLGALNKAYADRGFQIVGIVVDVTGSDGAVLPEMVELAGAIADETGADYSHILPSEDLAGLLDQAVYVPTTIFVDANGRQVGELYVGSMSGDEWEAIIVNLLDEVG